ncbi:MAG: (Fe-S)-binding protein [Elusimicrobiota bacterium]
MSSGALGRLRTALGERSDQDAVSQCSRCGYCEQVCPTYAATSRESFSPRGRNQIVRSLLEGKLADTASAQEALDTCLLCGAGQTACPAHVPTADLVLEGRRLLAGSQPGRSARIADFLLVKRPELLRALLKAAFAMKRWGLFSLASKLGLFKLLGWRGLEEAGKFFNPPQAFLRERLRKDAEPAGSGGTAWSYFAACGTDFLFPAVGLATLKVLRGVLGRGAFLDAGCCGLASYNYGSLESARALARALIERWEAAGSRSPLVGDCSSCVSFLKSYPQLFLADPAWLLRAERFSAAVRDIVECVPPAKLASGVLDGTIAMQESCRARHGQEIGGRSRKTLDAATRRTCASAGDACCGGAGLFAVRNPELSEELLLSKTAALAAAQADTVAVSSTSCLLQLERGLKKYYPEAKVVHWSELVAVALETVRPKGQGG